jgi:copper transporter 1
MNSMPLFFTWSVSNVYILFEVFLVSGTWQYILALLAVFLLAVAHEALRAAQRATLAHAVPAAAESLNRQTSLSDETPLFREQPLPRRWPRLQMTSLYVLQLTLAYLLMAIVMTYNLGLFVAVIAGAAIGFFTFFGVGAAPPPSTTEPSPACH